jgi:glycosyltransferase involved in cell wall biosynthesis
MDVSIVVPFHNEERLIEECIHALLALDDDKDRYEILMVNNTAVPLTFKGKQADSS